MKPQAMIAGLICAFVGLGAAAVRSNPYQPHGIGSSLAGNAAGRAAGAGAATADCTQRSNDTPARLEQCIRKAALWRHLSDLQQIADRNPDREGHGNRNAGTSGYKASVAYVAALMRQAGYAVTIQQYAFTASVVRGTPAFQTAGKAYALERDWFVARLSGGGTLTAALEPPAGSASGCAPSDFAGFALGRIALLERGTCTFDTQVANAEAAGARAVVLYNTPPGLEESVRDGGAYEARLIEDARVPVVGVAAHQVGEELLRQYRAGRAPLAHIDIRADRRSIVDYNVIADSPLGDPNHVVSIEGHLDSIYGAGILDNGSGSTTILEIALNLANTPTRNRLRYIWFGGEELGLHGSHYYATNLSPAELHRLAFDVDVDVTATPNYDILVADPAFAHNVKNFPRNVVPQSKIGNDYFAEYFQHAGVPSQPARFGNDGTDSNSFSVVGVPNTGILTQQDCCKRTWETKLWGGYLGNYEGDIPSFNGGCVDHPHRWCDNLSNNDPALFEAVSKAVAYVTLELANRRF
jgi:Zn-dependent M28 family amino/carboxypeptidase